MIHRSLLTGYFWKRLEIQRELKEDTCPVNRLKYMKNSYNIRFTIYTHGVSLVTQMVKNLPTMQETRLDPWIGKIPWRRE